MTTGLDIDDDQESSSTSSNLDSRPLPSGWVCLFSSRHGQPYFVDTNTSPAKTYWTHPEDIAESRRSSAESDVIEAHIPEEETRGAGRPGVSERNLATPEEGERHGRMQYRSPTVEDMIDEYDNPPPYSAVQSEDERSTRPSSTHTVEVSRQPPQYSEEHQRESRDRLENAENDVRREPPVPSRPRPASIPVQYKETLLKKITKIFRLSTYESSEVKAEREQRGLSRGQWKMAEKERRRREKREEYDRYVREAAVRQQALEREHAAIISGRSGMYPPNFAPQMMATGPRFQGNPRPGMRTASPLMNNVTGQRDNPAVLQQLSALIANYPSGQRPSNATTLTMNGAAPSTAASIRRSATPRSPFASGEMRSRSPAMTPQGRVQPAQAPRFPREQARELEARSRGPGSLSPPSQLDFVDSFLGTRIDAAGAGSQTGQTTSSDPSAYWTGAARYRDRSYPTTAAASAGNPSAASTNQNPYNLNLTLRFDGAGNPISHGAGNGDNYAPFQRPPPMPSIPPYSGWAGVERNGSGFPGGYPQNLGPWDRGRNPFDVFSNPMYPRYPGNHGFGGFDTGGGGGYFGGGDFRQYPY